MGPYEPEAAPLSRVAKTLAYGDPDFDVRTINESRPQTGEIYTIVAALKSAVADIEKALVIHTERLVPIRAPRPTDASEYPNEKRGCSTQLGDDLGSILDRLYSHRKNIENATNELEI